jgi:hypothetical protein
MIKYELTIKDLAKIKFNLNKIPKNCPIHLTDKGDNVSPFLIAPILIDHQLTVTFSIRNHYYFGKFDKIIEELNRYLTGINKASNISELLIVSGSNRGEVDTLKILEYLGSKDNKVNVGVAYNCNLGELQQEENDRLKEKLNYKFVKSVYIQITDDLDRIEQGIKYIRSLNKTVKIALCVLKPSNSLLNSLKLRPWKGVKLSQSYLDDLNRAQSINNWNVKMLKKYEIDYLITV